MGDDNCSLENGDSHHHVRDNNSGRNSNVLDIYPLNCYYFGSKEAVPLKTETVVERIMRMKANYDAHGMRNSVSAVMMVELFKHPHLLLLQVQNSTYKLPGGRRRPGESDIECLKRKLETRLSAGGTRCGPEWEVAECLGMWWKHDFETLLRPYLPPSNKQPKECNKVFLVKLPASRRLIVPKNFRILAVPLCQLHDNEEVYGPIIAGVPQLLSKYSFNFVDPE